MTRSVVSDGHPAHAVILARPRDAKPGVWIVAGVPVWRTYPCFCVLGNACNIDIFGESAPCRCWGRLDPDLNISYCCAARAARLSRKDEP